MNHFVVKTQVRLWLRLCRARSFVRSWSTRALVFGYGRVIAEADAGLAGIMLQTANCLTG